MSFNDKISNLKSSLKSLIDGNSSAEFIEKISSLDKDIDEVVNAHEETTKELTETKEALINHVKSTGFSNPSNENPTEPNIPKSLDDIMQDSLKKFKEEK